MGFQDSTAINTLPTDGCYMIINATNTASNTTLSGVCRSNSVQSNTSGYVLTPNGFYKGTITMNPTASALTFTLHNATNDLLWTDTVSSNIPTAAGRETGHGIIIGETTTDAARVILQLDYMDLMKGNYTSTSTGSSSSGESYWQQNTTTLSPISSTVNIFMKNMTFSNNCITFSNTNVMCGCSNGNIVIGNYTEIVAGGYCP
jgi:hypothetical protein